LAQLALAVALADFEEHLPKASVKPTMKSLLFALTLVAAAGMGLVSCRSGKSANEYATPPKYITQPLYESGTTKFLENTPPQFHQLQLGQTEEAVVKAVGKPDEVKNIEPVGEFGKPPVGKFYIYWLGERNGLVFVRFDTNMQVTGISSQGRY